MQQRWQGPISFHDSSFGMTKPTNYLDSSTANFTWLESSFSELFCSFVTNMGKTTRLKISTLKRG